MVDSGAVTAATEVHSMFGLVSALAPGLGIGPVESAVIASALRHASDPNVSTYRVVGAATAASLSRLNVLAERAAPRDAEVHIRWIIRGTGATAWADTAGRPRLPPWLRVDMRTILSPLPHLCIAGDAFAMLQTATRACDRCGRPTPLDNAGGAVSALVAFYDSLWCRLGPSVPGLTTKPAPDAFVDILELLAAGCTDRGAQRELNLSPRTFSRRMAQLLDALNASSRFQAGMEAARRGWV